MMKLYYEKSRYLVDDTLAIMTWTDEDGYLEPYGNVTVNLSAYGMRPDEGHIYMPTYKMTPDYRAQVLRDIAEEIVSEIQIGYGTGLYVRLKDDWEDHVEMVDKYRKEAWTE